MMKLKIFWDMIEIEDLKVRYKIYSHLTKLLWLCITKTINK